MRLGKKRRYHFVDPLAVTQDRSARRSARARPQNRALSRSIGRAISLASLPESRTTPMPPRPGGVAIATMVSSRCIETYYSPERHGEHGGKEGHRCPTHSRFSNEWVFPTHSLVPQVRVPLLDANLGPHYFTAGTGSPTLFATLNVSLPSRLSASTTMWSPCSTSPSRIFSASGSWISR